MKLQLPDSVSSSQDLAALELEMKDYSRWFSHNAIKERTNAKNGTPPPMLSPAALEVVRSWNGGKLLSQQSLDQLITTLETFRLAAHSMTITLAAPAPGSLKQTLVAWCRQNVAPDILVSFQFNSTLLGGMVVRYGSHTFDWSFRRQILDARNRFPEVLRNV